MNEIEYYDASNLSRIRCAVRILQENHTLVGSPENESMGIALNALYHVEELLHGRIDKHLRHI